MRFKEGLKMQKARRKYGYIGRKMYKVEYLLQHLTSKDNVGISVFIVAFMEIFSQKLYLPKFRNSELFKMLFASQCTDRFNDAQPWKKFYRNILSLFVL